MMPTEIVMSPVDIYIAYEGEAYPTVDANPSGNWIPLGLYGKRNQAESGVTLTHGQTLKEHFTTGSSGPVKVGHVIRAGGTDRRDVRRLLAYPVEGVER